MAANEKDAPKLGKPRNLWLHIKILYVSTSFLLVALLAAVCLGLREIQRLRTDLDEALSPTNFVDFEEHGLQRAADRQRRGAGDSFNLQAEHLDILEQMESEGLEGEEDEQLIRVKRRTHRRRSREGKNNHRRDNDDRANDRPSFYYESSPRRDGEDREGSGNPDPWVWLTSYSRIPVSTNWSSLRHCVYSYLPILKKLAITSTAQTGAAWCRMGSNRNRSKSLYTHNVSGFFFACMCSHSRTQRERWYTSARAQRP